jgi:hypothetical protein
MQDFRFNIQVTRNTILTTKLLGNTLPLAAFSRRFFKRRDIVRWIDDPSPLASLVLGAHTNFYIETADDVINIFTRAADAKIASFNAAVISFSSLAEWLTRPRSFQQILNASAREYKSSIEYNQIKYFLLTRPHDAAD